MSYRDSHILLQAYAQLPPCMGNGKHAHCAARLRCPYLVYTMLPNRPLRCVRAAEDEMRSRGQTEGERKHTWPRMRSLARACVCVCVYVHLACGAPSHKEGASLFAFSLICSLPHLRNSDTARP